MSNFDNPFYGMFKSREQLYTHQHENIKKDAEARKKLGEQSKIEQEVPQDQFVWVSVRG